MTHQTPHLLTKGELRRVEECAKENGTFAECWNSDQVVIVGCEPVGAHVCVTETPFMELDILSPTANPLSGSKSNKQHPTRQCCKKKFIVLENSKVNKRLRPKPWYYRYDSTEEFSLYYDDAKAKVKELFSQLATEYVSICIVSHDIQDSLSSLQKFDIELPSTTIFVDLIKVLEHQSRHDDQGIPKPLRKYTDDNIAIRNGRYDRRPWPLTGQYGMPNYALVSVLGPAAESCKRDKTEKEDGYCLEENRKTSGCGQPKFRPQKTALSVLCKYVQDAMPSPTITLPAVDPCPAYPAHRQVPNGAACCTAHNRRA